MPRHQLSIKEETYRLLRELCHEELSECLHHILVEYRRYRKLEQLFMEMLSREFEYYRRIGEKLKQIEKCLEKQSYEEFRRCLRSALSSTS